MNIFPSVQVMGRIHAILSDGTVVTDVEVWSLANCFLYLRIQLIQVSIISIPFVILIRHIGTLVVEIYTLRLIFFSHS